MATNTVFVQPVLIGPVCTGPCAIQTAHWRYLLWLFAHRAERQWKCTRSRATDILVMHLFILAALLVTRLWNN
jgi:hypothetical protein